MPPPNVLSNHRRSRPLAEPLELRQLLSATLSVGSSLMVFNAVEGSTSPVESLSLTNTGDTSLSLTGATVVAQPGQADASARFALVNGSSLPSTLAAGASFSLQVDYTASAVGIQYAVLDLASSDPVNPTTAVLLHGIGTAGLGGTDQPSLMRILHAYDEPNYANVGETDESNALYPEPPATPNDNVDLQQMVKAGPGDVTFTVLASFVAAATEPYVLGWYQPSNPAGTMQELFHTPTAEYQSTYVQPIGTTSFDPGSDVFGLYDPSQTVRVNGSLVTGYTQDALNTWDSTDARKFRFFPLEDASGNAVANSYIMTSTEWYAPVGYDFVNIVAIISNVKQPAPVAQPDAIATVAKAPTALDVLGNDTATTGTLVPSTVTITTAPASGGTATVDPTTGDITYVAPASFHGTDTFAYTVANSAGYTSAPATVTVTVGAGAGGIVTTAVSATAVAGVAQSIDVLANDTDAFGTLLPATVAIVAAPDAGGSATVNPDGTIAYTPAATFAGTETFSYTVQDTAGYTSAPTTVNVTVRSPAAAPVSTGLTATTTVGATTTFDVTAAVASSVGLNLSTIALASQPAHGSASVDAAGTISYVPAAGFVGVDAVSFTLSDIEGQASTVVTVPVSVGVRVGAAGDARSLVLPAATPATLTLNAGLATVYFTGAGTLAVNRAGRGTTTGATLALANLALSGTTAASTLDIAGRGAVTADGLSDDAVLGRLIAPATTLAGTVTLAGVQSMTVAGIDNGTLSIGSGAATVDTLMLGAVHNGSLVSAVPLRTVKATAWTNDGSASITAPSITTLNVTGNLQAAVTLTSAGAVLNSVSVGRQLDGAWSVAGAVRTLTAGTIAGEASLSVAGSLANLLVKGGGLAVPLTAGSLGTVAVRGDLTSAITADTAGSIRVTGNVAGASLALGGTGKSLSSLSVTGAISGSTITTAGSVGSVVAASMSGDTLLVGAADGTTFADVTTATLGTATLGSLRLTARSNTAFADTVILAHTLTTAALGTIDTANGGTADGLSLASTRSIVGTADGRRFHLTRPSTTAAVFGDFQIKVPTA